MPLKVSNRRIQTLFIISSLIFVFFFCWLVRIQGFASAAYAARASAELYQTAPVSAKRGAITDVNGIPLARSIASYNITVDQTLVNDPITAAKVLAPILDLSVADLQSKLTGTRRFIYIAKDVSPAIWSKVKNAIATENSNRKYFDRIAGFFVEDTFHRDYPSGPLGASVLGFVDSSGHGGGGLEYALDGALAGKNGSYTFATNGAGPAIPTAHDVLAPAVAGKDVRLTINRDIQWVAQAAITKKVKESGAQSGSIVVMEPGTGRIVAMATAPTFDPNNLAKATPTLLATPAVSDPYEPGSTGKVITMSAALEEKKITPTSLFTVPDRIKRADRIFKDHDKHATWKLTTAGILAKSSNVGTIQIGELISHQTLYNYLRKFGVGSSTHIELGGESDGLLLPVSQWPSSMAPAIAFGQSYSMTTIQATSVFATIANRGVRVTPTLIDGYVDTDGHYTKNPSSKSTRVISSETADKVRLMMESVLTDEGTAPGARIPGYRVAGKTGTANRVVNGKYQGYTASFIGFAPAENPKFVINVTIQDPHGVHFGSLLGGPVFKEVMSFALKTYQIPPSTSPVSLLPMNSKELAKNQNQISQPTKP